MLAQIKPWTPYLDRVWITSHGRVALVSAFADLIQFRSGFQSHELPDIFEAPDDDGENDACRDLVRINAEILTETFILGEIDTFARPLSGGEVTPIFSEHWEIDDPLPRFASGIFNRDEWAHQTAPPTHRIFLDSQQFDRWLAALKSPGLLSRREVEAILDPQVRAVRSAAAAIVSNDDVAIASDNGGPLATVDQSGLGPVLLKWQEVAELTSQSRSSIYTKTKSGQFPKQVKLGSSARWKKSEVLSWINEQAAKRGC